MVPHILDRRAFDGERYTLRHRTQCLATEVQASADLVGQAVGTVAGTVVDRAAGMAVDRAAGMAVDRAAGTAVDRAADTVVGTAADTVVGTAVGNKSSAGCKAADRTNRNRTDIGLRCSSFHNSRICIEQAAQNSLSSK
jgi:hypothetical protein